MTRRLIRWGIIGSSEVTIEFLDSLKKISNQRATTIFSTNASKADEISQNYGLLRFDNLDEMLSNAEIDCIYVASPNVTHLEFASKALKAEKHVLVEKPCCVSLAEIEILLSLAKELGRHAEQNMWILALPGIKGLLAEVGSGSLGEVEEIDIFVGFDILGRRLSMSKLNMVFRALLMKARPEWILKFYVPRGVQKFDRNDLFENIPHLSRKKNQGALMDFGIYGLSLIALLAPEAELKSASKQTVNEVDVWTIGTFKDKKKVIRFRCSLFMEERNYIRIKGSKASVRLENIFAPTHLIKSNKIKGEKILKFDLQPQRFVNAINAFCEDAQDREKARQANQHLRNTFRLLSAIKDKNTK